MNTRRVMMFPASGNANENRFIDVLVDALRREQIDVVEWRKARWGQRAPVLHVHWPEVLADIARRPWQRLRGRYLAWNLLSTVARVKRHGGRVVWTVHDLQVHDAGLREDPLCVDLMRRFAQQVDVFVSLTEAGIEPIRRQIVQDDQRPVMVARHPHYRGLMQRRDAARTAELRRQLGIPEGRPVVACLGSMRANKRVDTLASAFAARPPGEAVLLLAGSAPPALQREIEARLAGRDDVRLRFERIPEDEMLDLYSVSDLLVFPATGYFNSGTVYTALSLDLPVLVEDTAPNREIAALVGDAWVQRFRGPLGPADLAEALAGLERARRPCPMQDFDPARVAARHAQIYGF